MCRSDRAVTPSQRQPLCSSPLRLALLREREASDCAGILLCTSPDTCSACAGARHPDSTLSYPCTRTLLHHGASEQTHLLLSRHLETPQPRPAPLQHGEQQPQPTARVDRNTAMLVSTRQRQQPFVRRATEVRVCTTPPLSQWAGSATAVGVRRRRRPGKRSRPDGPGGALRHGCSESNRFSTLPTVLFYILLPVDSEILSIA